MYPFNGWVSNESSPLQSSLLVSERMAFKLHRQGMIMETIGKNNAVCNEYPSPILPKEPLALPDGEYVSGQRAVPPVRAQRDPLGNREKSAQHKEKLRLPDVA